MLLSSGFGTLEDQAHELIRELYFVQSFVGQIMASMASLASRAVGAAAKNSPMLYNTEPTAKPVQGLQARRRFLGLDLPDHVHANACTFGQSFLCDFAAQLMEVDAGV